jgi:DNA-binding ferritin-like protein (Dps family)
MKKIMTIIIETTANWPSFKPRFEALAASAVTSYQKVEPLVRYLESESIRVPAMLLTSSPHQRRNITADYQKMQATLIELSGFTERAKKMVAEGLIDELEEAKSQFSVFQEVLSATEYLADITDDVIYEALSDTIRENHSQPFVHFN